MTSFDESTDQLASALESVEMETGALWPKERVVLDSYQALGGLGNGGLIAFWQADIQQRRVIRSFRQIGAKRLADLIYDSKWARDPICFGNFDEEQTVRFEKLEHELFEELETVLDLIRDYIDRNELEFPNIGFSRRVYAPVYKALNWIARIAHTLTGRLRGERRKINLAAAKADKLRFEQLEAAAEERGVMEATPNANGYVTCPHCGVKFSLNSPSSWNAKMHLKCHTRIRLSEPS